MRLTRRFDDRGQAVLLLPAGFLIVLILGSLVLEAAALHLRQRQLDDLADSLANDAAAVGFDVDAFRETGEIEIDPERAARNLEISIELSNLPNARTEDLRVINGPDARVEVDLSIEHDYLIGSALLGGAPDALTATGTAILVPSQP